MKHKHKVVFDSNIYLSAIIFGGNPRQCLELARNKEIELFISKAILLEVVRNLEDKFGWQAYEVKEVIEGILEFANIVSPKRSIKSIKKDPSDNRILETAMEAKTHYIISGDKKHLLSLKVFKDIPIISAKQFLDMLYES